MTELIPINKADFNGAEINSVNARELHAVLESKQDFSTWIKKRLDEVDAVENVDFICFHKKMEANNATMIEYILSTDIAKEIAMLERNEVGKKVRRYFIEFEKMHKQKVIPLTQAEILAQSAALLVEQERRTAALETKTEEIRKEQLKAKHNINRLLNNDNYMTLIAFMNLHGISQKGYHIPSLGKRAKKLSDEQGAFMGAVIDPRYGRINTYSTEILKQIFKVA
nr:MAG TPA: AntA/AntB antirepressor [Caudoviricetes sp.]